MGRHVRHAMMVGLLFPGEMGAAVGAAARADVVWAGEGRSEATRRRAEQAGLEDVGTVAALVERSAVVLSVCPPAIAEDVVAEVVRLGFQGLYVEANAIAPTRMARVGAALAAAGARVVDGSIIARGGLHLYLAGEPDDVESVTALFRGTAVDAIPLSGGVGAASALKMAFGGWNKIGIALAAQAHAIARAYGVEAELAAEGVEPGPIVSAAPRAWRWAPEMEEVATTCAELGLPVGIAGGAADLYGRWEGHRDATAELARLLDELRDG
jgi:3-hydroxyisobutyrate dehydrogenase-like beta-hydroxyacid dehydrogenase